MKVNLSRYKNKSKVQIEKHDLWSLDFSLSRVILPALSAFIAEESFGVPSSFLRDCYPKYKDGELPEGAFEAWKDCLREMENAFKLHLDLVCIGLNAEEDAQRMQKGFNLFAKYYTSLWS